MHELAIFANTALLPDGWAERVFVRVDDQGRIVAVDTNVAPPGATYHAEVLLPGVPNTHSHAFQRGMAGLTEYRGRAKSDDFWSWRETMYRFVSLLQPEDAYTIARHAYVDMLRHGYTSVCEFHYLHHDAAGHPYASLSEMAAQHVRAAQDVGLRMTILPVLYTWGGFDRRELQGAQLRFRTDVATILDMFQELQANCANEPTIQPGLAVHSLRAATIEQISEVLKELQTAGQRCPVHLHIAEQPAEVEQCVARFGKRPLEYLASHFELNERWSLVHATHLSLEELKLLIPSRAVVVLCPVTEANLGDGVFPAAEFLHSGGRCAIGSDSQVSVSPWEELRMLEYGQRLVHRERNLLARDDQSTGVTLLHQVVEAGHTAAGMGAAGITPGAHADLISVDSQHAQLAGRRHDTLVDTLVFSGDATFIRDVFVGGRRVVTDGRHVAQQEIADNYRACLSRLLSAW